MSRAYERPRPLLQAGGSPCLGDIGQCGRRAGLRLPFFGVTRMLAARASLGLSVPKVSSGLCTLARCRVDTYR